MFWEFFNIKSKPLSFLVHEERKTREFARKTLNRIDPSWPRCKTAKGFVPEFISSLASKNEQVREAAAEVLGLIGDDQALDALIASLEDKKPLVRKAAAKSLGMIGDKKATDSLVRAIRHNNEDVAMEAAFALGAIGDNRYVAKLMEVTQNGKNPAVIVALGLIGDRQATELLIKTLKSKTARLRIAAARSLGMIGDTRAVGPLIKAMKDRNTDVRDTAVRSLGMLKDERALKPLMAILEKDVLKKWKNKFVPGGDFKITETACLAACALGDIGNIKSVPMLIDLKEKRFFGFVPPPVGDAAQKALEKMVERASPHHADLYCPTCFRRPGLMAIPLGVAGHNETIAFCPKCGDTRRFLTGVKKIVGLIGGNITVLSRDGDTLFVPLWIEKEKKSRYADIGAIEIREGGIGNYHLAINAVILDYSKVFSQAGRRTPVRIVGNPPLRTAVMRMIEDNFNLM